VYKVSELRHLHVTPLVCSLVIAFGVPAGAQVSRTVLYDHVHLAVPDPEQARDWYIKNLGGNVGETAERVAFEPWTNRAPLPVQFLFIKASDARPSDGGVIDSVGFSVTGLEAKVKALEAAGASLKEPVENVRGLWKRAVVEDPWGVKIELVEDPGHPGFHHITLRVVNPEESVKWYLTAFGGERTRLAGRLDALKYGTTYLIVAKGDGTVPSQGRAIDHLGWGPTSIDATAADLKAKNVTFTAAPQPKPNAFGHRTAYVEGPGGVRIELVEHTELHK
jgi:catechol 2,3-dioxygenase-like lactoylglutathione lyase family enzyme